MAPEEGLQVFGERREGQYILRLAGQIDLFTVGQFDDALEQASLAPERAVLVDLSEVESIDSSGISALMKWEIASRGDVDRVQFLPKLKPEVEQILRVSGIYEQLQFIEPEEADRGSETGSNRPLDTDR